MSKRWPPSSPPQDWWSGASKAPSQTDANGEPANPCVRNCCLDENDVCCGCKRTLQEILAWSSYSSAQKRDLLKQLKQRQ
ncbi:MULTISPECIES: DUF1289 domain-containing protein [unclassified Hahella]|uniref:DUF1289 domain-containing protein n=1 Tax=unclassified Hahella TaxID=2624107 RepID=UPI000FDE0833|nr:MULTISPECIES: DUF1289 domain-containing protein [unclassified Hahella]AZZ93583.1 DUF1289 domain-containing protein [Hahella sp. KA22]MDG9671742.1 DUF1289 domain-containing protein [Hahella sp. CR1]QAY56958.1 DUF1289 domain-containing protein [Hahella sp. KA22]